MGLGNKEIMANNIKYYLNLYNKTPSDICKLLGFPAATFSDWINAKSYPRIDKIELMANYFGISKSDLVEEHVAKKDEPSILSYYNSLNDMGKQEATKRVKELTYIPQYTARGPLLNAAHEIEGSSDEDKQHDEELLNKLYNNRNNKG